MYNKIFFGLYLEKGAKCSYNCDYTSYQICEFMFVGIASVPAYYQVYEHEE